MTDNSFYHPWMNNKGLLFYKNLPGFEDMSLPKPYDYILKNFKKPIIIYQGIGKVPLDDVLIPEKNLDETNSQGIDVFLDDTLTYRNRNPKKNFGFLHFSEFLSETDYSEITSEELESLENFAESNSLNNIRVFTKDYGVEKLNQNFQRISVFCYSPVRFREIDYDKVQKPIIRKPKMTFHCAINRYTPTRHLIMSYLAGRNGNFSWPFNASIENSMKAPWFEPEKFSQKHIKRLKKGSKLLKKQGKQYYIDETPGNSKTNIEDTYTLEIKRPWIQKSELFRNQTFNLSFSNCFCCIVNETKYAQPFPTITEKLIYPLLFGLPFVVVGPPGTLEFLRKEHGHNTFSDLWDESYDEIENHSERLKRIFDLIDYIDNLDYDQRKKFQKKISKKLQENAYRYQWDLPDPNNDI